MTSLNQLVERKLRFAQQQTPANLNGQRALCCDVGYQDALTVLVVASDWSESRTVSRLVGISIAPPGTEVKSKTAPTLADRGGRFG
jgi:hypothetical protein